MTTLPLFALVVISSVIVNGMLQFILVIYWILSGEPGRPLLKPVTLCAAVTHAYRSARFFTYSLRSFPLGKSQSHSQKEGEQLLPHGTAFQRIHKRIQQYV